MNCIICTVRSDQVITLVDVEPMAVYRRTVFRSHRLPASDTEPGVGPRIPEGHSQHVKPSVRSRGIRKHDAMEDRKSLVRSVADATRCRKF